MIEKLKDNEAHRIFGDMSDEEQGCLAHIGNENLEYLSPSGSYGVNSFGLSWTPKGKSSLMYPDGIYRIKPDYQPEPEFVDLEIKSEQMLGVYRREHKFLPYNFTNLHYLPSLPNFAGFHREGLTVSLDLEYVAKYIFEGKKVYAKLRK